MKRLRPVNSCLTCRNRRLKCDKQHPTCGRCMATNQICNYDGSSTAYDQGVDRSQSQSLQAARTSNQVDQTHGSDASTGGTERERGRFLFSQGGRTAYDGATYWGNAIPADVVETDDLHDGSRPPGLNALLDPVSVGTLAVEIGSFRLPNNSRISIPSSATAQCRLCGKGYRLSCVQAMLPDRETCTKLCSIFFGKVFPLIPILHPPSFRLDLDELMNALGTRNDCQRGVAPILRRRPGLLCLLFSIMFSALFCASPQESKTIFGSETPHQPIENHYLAIMIAAHLTGFPRRPSLYTLAAYIYAQSQFAREEAFRDAPEFVSLSFRIAIGMGLHRNLPNSNLSTSDIETRRRLWWYIQHLDIMASCSSGLSPLFIDEKMANASIISDHDEYSVNTGGEQIKQRDVRYVVAATRYEVSSEIRNILRLHFEDAFDSSANLAAEVQRLRELSVRINQVCNNLLSASAGREVPDTAVFSLNFSRTWGFEPIPADDRQISGFTSWAVILLHMMVHKAYCTLYHPLFSKGPVMDSAETIEFSAVEHAQAFLYLFIRLCDDPASGAFHWMYPGTYQPLQPLALLVADLLQRPWSDHFETSRGIIDEVFERYSVDHGIVNQVDPVRRDLLAAHKGAWTILARARRKALELSGEDPHILLPAMDMDRDFCLCGQQISTSSSRPQPRSSASASGSGSGSDVRTGMVVSEPGPRPQSSRQAQTQAQAQHSMIGGVGDVGGASSSAVVDMLDLQRHGDSFMDAEFDSGANEGFDWHGSNTMLGAGSGFMI